MPLIIPGNSQASTGYTIDQSIRFNEADSPYMQKTYSGDGSRTTWSFSFWTKLGKSPPYNSTRGNFLIAYNTSSGAQEDIRIEGSNQQLQWFTHNDGGTGTLADLKTTQYLRDHSAWYHILCVADRTNAVSSERQRMYINGQRVTDFATETYPSQSAEGHVGKSADVHYLGSRGGNSNTRLDGYMAEIHYLDGLAYDPSFFGEFNNSGIWIAKEYTGSYGTNGFKIDGRDSSDLGDDESGQGNDYTTSGLASNDQMSDSPTTNWCVMNPLLNNGCTYTNGNLEVAPPNLQSTHRLVLPTMGILPSDTNKYYWEITYLASDNSSSVNMLGIGGVDNPNNPASATLNGGGDGYGLGYSTFTSNIYAGANWTANGSPTWSGGFTASAVYGVAYDGSTKRLYFYENNSALNSGNHFATYTGSAPLGPGASLYTSPSSSKLIFNMGANGFTYTPPTGYVAVNTTNLGS